jgi:hypothetical protein
MKAGKMEGVGHERSRRVGCDIPAGKHIQSGIPNTADIAEQGTISPL